MCLFPCISHGTMLKSYLFNVPIQCCSAQLLSFRSCHDHTAGGFPSYPHLCLASLCLHQGRSTITPDLKAVLRKCFPTRSSLLLSSPCAQEGNFVIFFPFCVAKPRHGPASVDQPACLPWGGLPEQDDRLTSTSCIRQGQSETCSGVAQDPRARRCLF